MLNAGKILLPFLLLIGFTLFGCHPALKKEAQRPEEALNKVHFFYPTFRDDMNFESLGQALKRNVEYLNRLEPGVTFQFGPHSFTCQEVKESQEVFLKLIAQNPGPGQLNREIRKHYRMR